MNRTNNEKIVIIGAGMAGCFMALNLAKRGYETEIYESRPDVRKEPYDSGRSFNLTLYYRGILAMKKMGIWDDIKKVAIVAEGNSAHYSDKKIVFDPFDANGDEILYTVHRNKLNRVLLDLVDKTNNIKVYFNTRCIGIDKFKKIILFQKKDENEIKEVQADMVIGADGVHSLVRSELQKGQPTVLSQVFEDWGYKEVHISREMTKVLNLRQRATHTWPRNNSLLIAFPNPDDSFTLMFNLPLHGDDGFDALKTETAIKEYISLYFPDLLPLLPEIQKSFLQKPTGSFITTRTEPWYYKDFIVIIGDAAHSVIPFYGQGVCAAFEDCLSLAEQIDKQNGNWQKIFAEYQLQRKKNTDILADLSKENFIELRDKSRSPYYVLKDKANTLLNRWFPRTWQPPLYISIAHTSKEYLQSVKKFEQQEKLAKYIGLDFILFLLSIPLKMKQTFQRMRFT